MTVGQVTVREPLGGETLIYVTDGQTEVIASASGRTPPEVGETVQLGAPAEALHLFDGVTGMAVT